MDSVVGVRRVQGAVALVGLTQAADAPDNAQHTEVAHGRDDQGQDPQDGVGVGGRQDVGAESSGL